MLALPPAPTPAPRRQVVTATALAGAAMTMFVGGMLAIWWRFREASPMVPGGKGMIHDWIPRGVTVPEVPSNIILFTLITACLMAQYAVYAAKRGDRTNTLLGVSVVGLLGVAVLNAQALIYNEMKMGIRDGAYQSMFYAITGTFVVLAIIGMVFTAVALLRTIGAGRPDHEIVVAHALYWYILTGVFCAVWFVIYVTK